MANQENQKVQFIDERYYKMKNYANKEGQTIIYYPVERIVYVYKIDELTNYKDLHNAASHIMITKPQLFWGYDLILYQELNKSIKLIKKIYKEIKTINRKDLTNEYERLRNKYNINITDSHFDSMIFNPFKIVDEYTKNDVSFDMRCKNIEAYIRRYDIGNVMNNIGL